MSFLKFSEGQSKPVKKRPPEPLAGTPEEAPTTQPDLSHPGQTPQPHQGAND